MKNDEDGFVAASLRQFRLAFPKLAVGRMRGTSGGTGSSAREWPVKLLARLPRRRPGHSIRSAHIRVTANLRDARKLHDRYAVEVLTSHAHPRRLAFLVLLIASMLGATLEKSAAQDRELDLRSLPFIRGKALPISDGTVKGLAPAALDVPSYCDAETLRSSATLRAIEFWDRSQGIAVGDLGTVLVSRDGGQTWSPSTSGVDCLLADVVWLNRTNAIAIGGGMDPITQISRGVILMTSDGGQSWRRGNDSDLPTLRQILIDRGNSRTGRPTLTIFSDSDPVSGATRFESRDGGMNWQATFDTLESADDSAPLRSIRSDQAARLAAMTKTNATIRASTRLDETTWLAAGDHGVILRSSDNGESWQPVHGQGRQSGVLVIASQATQIPWALVGREALENRIRVSVLVGDSPNQTNTLIASRQAVMQLGSAGLDRYAADHSQAMIASLRDWLRVHQSPVVVIDSLLDGEVKKAIVQNAVGDGAAKVAEYSTVRRGEQLLHDSALLTGCGVLAGDFAQDSRLLTSQFDWFAPGTSSRPPWISVDMLYDGGRQTSRAAGLTQGIGLARRHRLPARSVSASRRRLQVVRGRLKQLTSIEQVLHQSRTSVPTAQQDSFADALDLMMSQTSRPDQFRTAWTIAERAVGHPHQVDVWRAIADRFPHSSAALLARLHQRAREASVEWQHHAPAALTKQASFAGATEDPAHVAALFASEKVHQATTELLPSGSGHAAIVSPFQTPNTPAMRPGSGVVQAAAFVPGVQPVASPAAARGKGTAPVDLAWQLHPVRLIVDHSIQNQSEEPSSPNETTESGGDISADLRRIAQRGGPWSGLLKASSAQATTAVHTASVPRLDGRLDDACWSGQPASTLGDSELRIRCAWDQQFVYIAIESDAGALSERSVPGDIGRRDADLSSDDRICIGLDMDQDLLTALNLAFTRRWTNARRLGRLGRLGSNVVRRNGGSMQETPKQEAM